MSPRPAHNERAAMLCGLAAVLLWSTVATGFKLGLAIMAPVQLLWLGAVVSCGFFTCCFIVRRAWRAWPERPGRLALLGLANPVAYYLILFEAYDRLPAQIAQPLNYTWSITLALLAVPLLHQPLTPRIGLGIAISYAGVVVLVTQGGAHSQLTIDPLGVALALGSTVIWAGYWLATVRLSADPIVTMTVGFATGALVLTVACAGSAGLPPLTAQHLVYGVWVGLIEMGFAFLLWQMALARTENAAKIGQLIYLSPCVSLVLIGTVLGEPIQVASVAGLAVIIAGLIVARRRS
jgi:drug/metabolite transporter (DMT)-like permease